VRKSELAQVSTFD